MNQSLSAPDHGAYRASVQPHGVLEEFACQRLATARWYYERATALAAASGPESPEAVRFQNMALRWEGSYNRAMRELRQLQTGRALANPGCSAPLADLPKIQPVAKRNGAAGPQPQSNQEGAKRNPDPYPGAGRNSPCPCGADKKYKRCCGVNAPPILSTAA